MTERGEGCLDHVVRVRRTDRFGDDILHAERLEDRPHRAAGDNAGAGFGRPNDYLAGAVAVGDIMVQGAALAQRHADHAAPGLLVALRIASGTSRALPAPYPTRPFLSPTMTSAAKPNRRPPFTTLATRLMLTSFSANSLSSRSRGGPSPSRLRRSPCVRAISLPSEIQPALAGGVGQGLDPAMIHIGAAIEHDALDAGRLGALGDQLADCRCRRLVGPGLQIAAQSRIERRGRRKRVPGGIVDDLGIDMARGTVHRQAGGGPCPPPPP